MFDLDIVRRFGLFWYLFPDRIDVRTVEISGAVPAPTPDYNTARGVSPHVKHMKGERKRNVRAP